MRVALTGATGFVGRAIARELLRRGCELRCWRRPSSRLGSLAERPEIEWLEGDLTRPDTMAPFVAGCDAVVHAALWRPGESFRGGEGDVPTFVRTNVLGTLELIEAARKVACERFVFISTCAVHEIILDDRPLDETHPLWPTSHYGAHKAAIEKFVHSYGFGDAYPICALRPTGVYGAAEPIERSKWYDLVRRVVRGETVECSGGGKEVHAADVARAVHLVLTADAEQITGQAFNLYDMYVSQHDVARLARELSGSDAEIRGGPSSPKHEIVTEKIRSLGMEFPGAARLRETVEALVAAARSSA